MKFDVVQLESTGIDVIDGDRGKNYPHQNELLDTGFCLFLSAKNVTKSGFNFFETKFISQRKDALLKNGKLKRGDIVITTRGTVGNVALYSPQIFYDNVRINSGMLIIRCTNNISNQYLYQVLRSEWFQKQIMAVQSGSAQPQLPKSHFLKMYIPLPSLPIQEKIASILQLIDDKVMTNNAINNNLLQQLHVLYLRLFCDSAMDTPLGDVVATTSGGTPSRKHDEYYSDSSICWVKSKELVGNYIQETEEHINDLAIKESSAKYLPEHSVLIAMYGATVGAYGVISKPMTCNQAVCALLCNKNYPYTYLFQIAYESQQQFINLAVGSAQQNISQVLIKQLNLHSDLDIIQKFHGFALPMHKEIESLQAENMRLSALRDNLLPKLMSGELDVSNIEI